MDQSLIESYGIHGIVTLLILKEIFAFIKFKSNGKNGNNGNNVNSQMVDYFRQIIDQLKLSNRQTYDLWE